MDIHQTAAADHSAGSSPSAGPGPARTIRDRIFGGLVLAMPLVLTLWIIGWLYSILELKIIDPLVGLLLVKLQWTTSGAPIPYWFETFGAPITAIILVLVLLYTLDFFADTRFHNGIRWALRRVPIFSQIYSPMQQIFQSLEQKPEQQKQLRMVLVTFPHPGVKLPAFVTGGCRDIESGKLVLCVYVPTTPVPTSGFFLLVPEEEVTELNWNTEQTLQAVMSGGLACPSEVSYFAAQFSRVGNCPPPSDKTAATQGKAL